MKEALQASILAAGVVVGVAALIAASWVALGIATAFLVHGFTLAEMDWNRDGRTTLMEMLDGADVAERQSADDPRCWELFFPKDGRTAKIMCPPGIDPPAR